jgi:hypothetical protein
VVATAAKLSAARLYSVRAASIAALSKVERPANGQHVLFCEDQLRDSLPLTPQLPFLVHASHVVARLPDSGQRATLFGRQRAV